MCQQIVSTANLQRLPCSLTLLIARKVFFHEAQLQYSHPIEFNHYSYQVLSNILKCYSLGLLGFFIFLCGEMDVVKYCPEIAFYYWKDGHLTDKALAG